MEKRIKYNSAFFAYFFMQYGLLIPLIVIVGPEIPIIIFSLTIMLVSFHLNKNYLKAKQFYLFIIIFLLLLSQVFIFPLYNDGLLKIIISFLTISLSSIWIGSCKVDGEYIIKYLIILSYINFLINVFIPFSPFYLSGENSQMRFAYAILPSAIVSIYCFFQNKNKVINLSIFLIIIIEIFIFGSRGAFLAIILFFLLFIMYYNMSTWKKIVIILLLVSPVFFIKDIEVGLQKILDNTQIETPAFNRYKTLLKKGFLESSSGRDEIYNKSWEMFTESPLIGQGVGYFPSELNTQFEVRFAHNFFIQIFFEYGVFIGSAMLLFLAYLFFKMYNVRHDYFAIGVFIIVFSTVFGRLLVSSSYWGRPEFWLIISYMWMYKTNHKNANRTTL